MINTDIFLLPYIFILTTSP